MLGNKTREYQQASTGTVDPVRFRPLGPSLSSLELSYLCPVEKIALSYNQAEVTHTDPGVSEQLERHQ